MISIQLTGLDRCTYGGKRTVEIKWYVFVRLTWTQPLGAILRTILRKHINLISWRNDWYNTKQLHWLLSSVFIKNFVVYRPPNLCQWHLLPCCSLLLLNFKVVLSILSQSNSDTKWGALYLHNIYIYTYYIYIYIHMINDKNVE